MAAAAPGPDFYDGHPQPPQVQATKAPPTPAQPDHPRPIPVSSPRRMSPEDVMALVPARILERQQALWDAQQHVEFCKRQAKDLEAQVYAEVASMESAPGKKVYSNAEAREAATRQALSRDERAARLQASLDGALTRRTALEADLDYLRDVQRNARVLLLARSPMATFWDDVRDLGA